MSNAYWQLGFNVTKHSIITEINTTERVHTSKWLSIEIQGTKYLYDMPLDFGCCCNHYVLVTVDNAMTKCIHQF